MNPLRLRERTSSRDQPASADDHRARILFTSRCKPENPGISFQLTAPHEKKRPRSTSQTQSLTVQCSARLEPIPWNIITSGDKRGSTAISLSRSTVFPFHGSCPRLGKLGTIIKGKQHRRTRFTSLRVRHATECRAKGEQQTLSLDHLMCKSKITCLSFIG